MENVYGMDLKRSDADLGLLDGDDRGGEGTVRR